ncbi:hypothetical protein DEO72_LG1g1263 [Vigna unguiculata]|uniref:Uncharacterized protein n=1 Tax=Vigna unguiculata TaxID=3917 RepID=A0A4D6KPR3_VIGUN|nr:hypothetical protein DEO72_LG1g1263 [Vigna unguiculata]
MSVAALIGSSRFNLCLPVSLIGQVAMVGGLEWAEEELRSQTLIGGLRTTASGNGGSSTRRKKKDGVVTATQFLVTIGVTGDDSAGVAIVAGDLVLNENEDGKS